MKKYSIRDQVLALAGITQAAALASQIARNGNGDSTAMEGTVHSILMLDADNCESIFIDRQHLKLGLQTLRDTFERDGTAGNDILRYCASMLHLQRRLGKNHDMLETIGKRVQQIQKQVNINGSETHSNIISNIAAVYLDTISTFRFRIQVNGNPQYLQQESTANQIRTVLLGGIRAVTLWRQMGGSRLDFILKRKIIYKTALALLEA